MDASCSTATISADLVRENLRQQIAFVSQDVEVVQRQRRRQHRLRLHRDPERIEAGRQATLVHWRSSRPCRAASTPDREKRRRLPAANASAWRLRAPWSPTPRR